MLASEGSEVDAEEVSKRCTELLPRFQTFASHTADLIAAAHSIVEDVYHGTRNFGETDEERARFQFTNSGVVLDRSEELPDLDPGWGWWRVVPSGADPNLRFDLYDSDTRHMVLPGSYDIYWAHGLPQRERPIAIQRNLEIKGGEFPTVRVDSGAKIVAAEWVPAIADGWGWWGAVPAGGAWSDRVNWRGPADAPIVLAPGEYDILWAQGIYQRERPVRIASNVTIGAGELKSVSVNTGIRLRDGGARVPGAAAFDPDWGWWAIVPVGGGDDDWINYSRGDTAAPLVVPPGTYDILWDAGLGTDTIRVAERVVVRAGELVEVGGG
jgi:hypothetical protein